MFSFRTIPALFGILLLSALFLLGQEGWGPIIPKIDDIDPDNASIGTKIRITGNFFGNIQGESTITFNGELAEVASFWTNSVIRVEVPSGAVSGPVVVTVDGQQSNQFSFVINDPIYVTQEYGNYMDSLIDSARSFYWYLSDQDDPEAAQKTVEWLMEKDGVQEAILFSNKILVSFENGIETGFTIVFYENQVNEYVSEDVSAFVDYLNKRKSKISDNSSRRAIILNAIYDESKADMLTHMTDLENALRSVGYEVDPPYFGSDVTMKQLLQIRKYDFVYIISHGSTDPSGRTWISTGERAKPTGSWDYDFSKEFVKKDDQTFYRNGKWKTRDMFWVSDVYLGIPTYRNSLIMVMACESFKNNTLSNALLESRAHAYAGWTNYTDGTIILTALPYFLDGLMENGISLKSVKSQRIDPYININHPVIKYCGDDNKVRHCYDKCYPVEWVPETCEYGEDGGCYGDDTDVDCFRTRLKFSEGSDTDNFKLVPIMPNEPPSIPVTSRPQGGENVDISEELLFAWELSEDPEEDRIKYCLIIETDAALGGDEVYNICDNPQLFVDYNHHILEETEQFLGINQHYWWAVWAIDEHNNWSRASDWSDFTTYQSCITDEDCNDHSFCNGLETCIENICQPVPPSLWPCQDDGLYCNGLTGCDENSDECFLNDVICDDGNTCTKDNCEEPGFCNRGCVASSPEDDCCSHKICIGSPVCEMVVLPTDGTLVNGQLTSESYNLYSFEVIPDGRCYTITVTPSTGNPDLYAARYLDHLDELSDLMDWETTCPTGSRDCGSSSNAGLMVDEFAFESPSGEPNYYSYAAIYGTWDSSYSIKITNGECPTYAWNKVYGGPDGEYAFSFNKTLDDGYIIVGDTSSYGAGSSDMWLFKIDRMGNEMWSKTIGGTEADRAQYIQITFDDGYIITGSTYSYGEGLADIWLVKTDELGNEEWSKTFGGSDDDFGYAVQNTSDGGYIIVGLTYSFGGGWSDVWIVKTDEFGNELWNKTFGLYEMDGANSVQQTLDGGYIIAGFTESFGSGWSDIWILKTDQFGNVLWNKTYGGIYHDRANSIQQTTDGGYIITGYTYSFGAGSSDILLIKIDEFGNEQWQKTFGGINQDFSQFVQQTLDGGYIVVGDTRSYGSGYKDVWLIKTDEFGNQQWERLYGGPEHDGASQIRQAIDGGYMVVGYSVSYGIGSADFWLIKTDEFGMAPATP